MVRDHFHLRWGVSLVAWERHDLGRERMTIFIFGWHDPRKRPVDGWVDPMAEERLKDPVAGRCADWETQWYDILRQDGEECEVEKPVREQAVVRNSPFGDLHIVDATAENSARDIAHPEVSDWRARFHA